MNLCCRVNDMGKKETVPQVRFKGFDGEWVQADAGFIFDTRDDRRHPELPVLAATQELGMVQRSKIHYDISYDKKNAVTYKRVMPGQFVIHLRSFQGGFAHSDTEGITSPVYTVMDFKDKETHDDYFWKYVFASDRFIKRLETVTYGIRDGRSIHYADFKELNFAFPKREEQEKIGRFLRELNCLISRRQEKYEKVRHLKKAMLEKMFPEDGADVPELRFKGFTEAWKRRKLGDCFDERQECSANGELISVTIQSGIKKFSELGRHDHSSEDKSHYKKVEIGDIAYNTMRMWQGASGYSPYGGILSPAYTVIVPRPGINSLFFSYVFKRPAMIHQFQLHSQGITSDTWNLKYPVFSEIVCAMPDDKEQEQIAEYFAQLDRLIDLYRLELEKLQNLKKALLDKMVV